ncbi:signal transduction histidine kinase [Duganella sp. 1224]|uniref:ATP-binding protein n=1 Tax=Duganella sp. 1224 TaxID=2587052 RepID=UPI0015C82503|nr:ATP-binding protein [Duganella sp. 1224]NYE60680.1 signal transduction histidine kinase [Duganella sp. 1224]
MPPMSTPPTAGIPLFLSAPGELGARIWAHEWERTPLGPIAGWPHSLKTVINLMLNSPQPMWMGWGEQVTFLYNDAYIDVLSMAKHPWALGRPAAEVWAEIWDICGPLADRVFTQGESTMADNVRLFMRRGDFLEETFYAFSYSPVRDESGAVAGLFCANLDVTTRYLNARRMRTLSDLSARTLQEKTVQGACAIALATIADNPDDVPFAQLYLAGDTGPAQLLHATHGDIDDAGALFAVDAVIAGGAPRTVALATGAPAGLPVGLAQQPLREALVLPLQGSGAAGAVGALVLGVSSARKLDADYRSFLELIATQAGNAIRQARAAEDERLRADKLAALDQAKTQFFSNVSHEFRTPLTLLLGPVRDALEDDAAPLPPAQRERLLLMQRNALRLQKLVNTLLEFSRVQAGRAQARFVAADLVTLTSDLASSFRSAIEGAGMRLEVDCRPLVAQVYVDPAMWEKIVLNLLSNAFKFTFEGEIRVRQYIAGDKLRLEVADTGTGIARDQLAHLFDRFHRVEGARSRTHEGSGIGLALVHDLVALHGGQIGVESEPGRGSLFRVTVPLGCAHLPAAQVDAAPAAAPPLSAAAEAYVSEAEGWVQQQPAPAPDQASHGRLLVVDDNADMRDYLQRLLRGQWQVEVCNNGVEALAAVARHAPDLILSDVMMPQLDGFGLLAALRAQPATRDIPFMLLSARAGEEARLEGLQAGADDYLVKPFSARELAARIEVLRLRQRVRLVEAATTRRLQSVFSQAPVAICILSGPEHVFEQANDYYQRMVGPRPLIGLTIRQAFPELASQGIYELLDGVLHSGQPYVGRSLQISLRRAPDQEPSECWFDFVYQPLLDDDDRPYGVAVVAFEVTELASAKRAAEAANRAKDEFLAMLGHELRNPLAPIVTALQLMRMRGGDFAVKERAVIERQTNHLVALVDDLLDVSRVAEGKIQLSRQVLEMADVIARAIETASPLIEQKRHVLTLEVPSSGLAVQADPVRCAQVLANLLTNAAKYTEAGGRLSVTARRDGGEVVVEVRDNGIGIAPEMIGVVFDRFTQARQALSRSQGGLGLGLAIARSMMALHGGSVAAASDGPGCGSTFTVRMPAWQGQELAGVPAGAAAAAVAVPPGGLAILVVDDNEDAARALGEGLELLGHTVKVVYSAPAALAEAPRFRPQVGLLDIGLPGMDGYELALRLREQPGAGALRLFAVTGYGQDADRQKAHDAGFERHLTKPLDLARLDELLQGARVA